jgi:hypothetical protein
VNPSDLAIIAMAVVALASIGRDLRVQMKVADRLRLVNPPPKQQATVPDAAANTVELDKRRAS